MLVKIIKKQGKKLDMMINKSYIILKKAIVPHGLFLPERVILLPPADVMLSLFLAGHTPASKLSLP
jgi:hypothetical protein